LIELAFAAAVMWAIQLALPWRPWSTRERIDAKPGAGFGGHAVTVLIPARDEAATIGVTLDAVVGQSGVARVLVVDDGSSDDTAAIAEARSGVEVLRGGPTPAGWSGKLWAQQQALARADTEWLLLLDADIRLAPGMVAALLQKAGRDGLDQVSVMALLPAGTLPEKLMLPAFVYFFKQLYPFSRVNRAESRLAAAAGGCVLVRRALLDRAGAFAAWRGALIDDCELARRVQAAGGRIWLGLSRDVVSMRRHPDLGSILETVRRTAYVQLAHSPLLLVATVGAMLLAFAVPPAAVVTAAWTGHAEAFAAGLAGWLLAALAYAPQVRFQRLSPAWALTLPAAAMLFLYATLDSAFRHHFGRGAGWKGRSYRPGVGDRDH